MINFQDVTSTKVEGQILTFKDGQYTAFDLSKWLSDNANAIQDSDSDAGMKVRILASASGMLINGRVYPGPEWKKAASKFADKPILKHHNSMADAIGRITKGSFEQLVKGPSFKNDRDNPSIQGKGQPTGLVYVDAHITDPDAIDKIATDRLLHTSQGSRARSAICSICGNNWGEGTWCEHYRGEIYKDEKTKKKQLCYWIIEGLEPKEVSTVNEPAMGESKIISTDSITDSTDERFMEMLDTVSGGTAIALGGSANQLYLTDAAGNVQDIHVIKEEKIEILDLSNQIDNNGSDDESVATDVSDDSVTNKETKDMADKEVNTENLDNEIRDLKAQVQELTKSSASLREDNEALTSKLSDSDKDLTSLQDEHTKLLDSVQGELIVQYLEIAKVSDEDKEGINGQLAARDVETLRMMVSEAKRISNSASIVADGIEAQASGTEGDSLETETTEEPTKPVARKSKNSLRRI